MNSIKAEDVLYLDDYQEGAAYTLTSEMPKLTPDDLLLLRQTIQALVDVGKVADAVKKSLFHQHQDYGRLVARRFLDKLYALPKGDRMEQPMADAVLSDFWNLLGLCGETGEMAQHLAFPDSQLAINPAKLIDEAGDTLWYLTAILSKHRAKLSVVAQRNLTKIQMRYPRGWRPEDSSNRVEYRTVPPGSAVQGPVKIYKIDPLDPDELPTVPDDMLLQYMKLLGLELYQNPNHPMLENIVAGMNAASTELLRRRTVDGG